MFFSSTRPLRISTGLFDGSFIRSITRPLPPIAQTQTTTSSSSSGYVQTSKIISALDQALKNLHAQK